MDLNARVDVKGRRKFSNDQCDLIPLQVFFFFLFFHFDLIQHQGPSYLYSIQNFSQIYQAVLEKMLILLVILFLVSAAILNSRPD